jgi:RimJ/RimL family protein N-acetyltransferase
MFSHPLADGVELRPLEPWHAEEFAAHVDRVREHIAPWIPFTPRIVDVDTARGYLRRYAERHALDSAHLYGIWNAGRLDGGALFAQFDAVSRDCEIGVWLDPVLEGRGIITTTCRRMIDWAIRERGMLRVEWHCDPRNARSRAVATRLGLTHEGTLRRSFTINGERQDTEIWALLADDWVG